MKRKEKPTPAQRKLLERMKAARPEPVLQSMAFDGCTHLDMETVRADTLWACYTRKWVRVTSSSFPTKMYGITEKGLEALQ